MVSFLTENRGRSGKGTGRLIGFSMWFFLFFAIDLVDGGAAHIAETIMKIKQK